MKTKKILFTKSKGNKKSRTLKVYFDGSEYTLSFYYFDRTDPLIIEKAMGIKPKRILIKERTFTFNSLESVDYENLPNQDLVSFFLDYKPNISN